MYVPATRERVRLANVPGVYLVLWVDADCKRADLLRLDENQLPRIEEGVSFGEIMPLTEEETPDLV